MTHTHNLIPVLIALHDAETVARWLIVSLGLYKPEIDLIAFMIEVILLMA
jgi:hypothetical protein